MCGSGLAFVRRSPRAAASDKQADRSKEDACLHLLVFEFCNELFCYSCIPARMTTTSRNITRPAQEWMLVAFVYGDVRKPSLWRKMLPVTNKASGSHRWSPATRNTSVLGDVKVMILGC